MRVLVTGSTGQVGSEVLAALAVSSGRSDGPGHEVSTREASGHQVLAPSREELDLWDLRGLADTVRRLAPDAVVNCAAYNAVDGAEEEPELAARVNGEAVEVLASSCAELGARLVHVSTDYVFSGERGAPYDEGDEPDPRSAYGRSKRRGELALLRSTGSWTLVRTSWVFGHRGRSFVEAILGRALAGDPLRVVDDQRGSPTYARDLARVLARFAVEPIEGVLHVTNSGSCTWHGLALEVLAAAGLRDVPVEAISTAELGRPAPRPRDSRLASEALDAVGLEPLRHHRDALAEAVPEMLQVLRGGESAEVTGATGGRR